MIADKTEMERDINVKRERERRGRGGGHVRETERKRETREREIERASGVRKKKKKKGKIASLCFSFDQRTSRRYIVRKDAADSRGGRMDESNIDERGRRNELTSSFELVVLVSSRAEVPPRGRERQDIFLAIVVN